VTNELKHEFVSTNGVNLHVVKAGSDDKNTPLVLMLHGFPEFWYAWHKQIQPLADAGFTVWAPDGRGYNLSDKPSRIADYDIDILARDVIGLIEAAGREKAVVVAHDWGALVAWWLATKYPEYVEKLVAINVPHPVVAFRQIVGGNPAQTLKSWYMFFFQIPFLPDVLAGLNNFQAYEYILTQSSRRGTFTPADLAEYRKAWGQPGAITSMLNWYRAAFRRGPKWFQEKDVRVTVPTLILWGKNDVALSPETAKLSQDICDNARLVYFEKNTHWLQHERPDDINQRIIEFVKEPVGATL
jgi:epoxide hydrolase 4